MFYIFAIEIENISHYPCIPLAMFVIFINKNMSNLGQFSCWKFCVVDKTYIFLIPVAFPIVNLWFKNLVHRIHLLYIDCMDIAYKIDTYHCDIFDRYIAVFSI